MEEKIKQLIDLKVGDDIYIFPLSLKKTTVSDGKVISVNTYNRNGHVKTDIECIGYSPKDFLRLSVSIPHNGNKMATVCHVAKKPYNRCIITSSRKLGEFISNAYKQGMMDMSAAIRDILI